jgi:hypothetical protein
MYEPWRCSVVHFAFFVPPFVTFVLKKNANHEDHKENTSTKDTKINLVIIGG